MSCILSRSRGEDAPGNGCIFEVRKHTLCFGIFLNIIGIEKAVVLLNEAIDLNNKAKNIKDLQEAADYFLKNCYNAGITYEK